MPYLDVIITRPFSMDEVLHKKKSFSTWAGIFLTSHIPSMERVASLCTNEHNNPLACRRLYTRKGNTHPLRMVCLGIYRSW